MELKFFKKKSNSFLVLDIGTEAVKSLIFRKNFDKISILGSDIKYFESGGDFNKVMNFEELEMEKIKRTVSECLKNSFNEFSTHCEDKKIKDEKDIPVLLTLSPEILRSEVIEIFSIREKKEKKISKKEQDIVYKYVLKSAKRDVLEKISKKIGIMQEDIILNSFEITDKNIDGYQVKEINGCCGKILSFKVLVIFSLKNYFERIQDVLKSQGLNVLQTFHLSETISSVFEDIEDGTFFDVGGEITQAFSFKNKKLEKVKLFYVGGNDFTDILLNLLKINRKDAITLKEKYCSRDLTFEVEKKIEQIFSIEKKKWKKIFKKYSDLSVFIFGGGSNIFELKDVFKKRKIISIKNFKQIQDLTKRVKNPQFVPAILIILFYVKKVF